jgi:hypothetical protein
MSTETYIAKRIEMLQEELEFLKRTGLKTGNGQPAKLGGIWIGVDFSDEEIEETKLAWTRE